MKTISRRKVLITGAVGGLALADLLPTRDAQADIYHWRGSALGAEADIRLLHPKGEKVGYLIQQALDEIERLERVFSLYRPDSSLVELNRTGALQLPPLDLVAVLGQSQMLAERSGGAFDPTVQPLFALYARHFAQVGAAPAGPDPRLIDQALRLVDYGGLHVSPARISFLQPGMAVTLNGIAQGYIADRVADRLVAAGVTDALIGLGEIRALGLAADKQPWRAGIGHGNVAPQPVLMLGDTPNGYPALASSRADGTVFEPSGRINHLLDPRTGRSVPAARAVSVAAPTAMLADGLSTALAIMAPEEGARLTTEFPGIRVIHAA